MEETPAVPPLKTEEEASVKPTEEGGEEDG